MARGIPTLATGEADTSGGHPRDLVLVVSSAQAPDTSQDLSEVLYSLLPLTRELQSSNDEWYRDELRQLDYCSNTERKRFGVCHLMCPVIEQSAV